MAPFYGKYIFLNSYVKWKLNIDFWKFWVFYIYTIPEILFPSLEKNFFADRHLFNYDLKRDVGRLCSSVG